MASLLVWTVVMTKFCIDPCMEPESSQSLSTILLISAKISSFDRRLLDPGDLKVPLRVLASKVAGVSSGSFLLLDRNPSVLLGLFGSPGLLPCDRDRKYFFELAFLLLLSADICTGITLQIQIKNENSETTSRYTKLKSTLTSLLLMKKKHQMCTSGRALPRTYLYLMK